ncbi:ABC transporter [Arthrobacter alpinus]|uniref:ABC transporter ATP-binding protein n=1 Tax=Arthrobacter alpinus TaxID=656366 RepID=UPI0005C94ED1|nr:ABC transporter ATP-binding protein [Arthrobacter alpinus]ALV47406.1 ABC transporter [Arthrobacter alpinus]
MSKATSTPGNPPRSSAGPRKDVVRAEKLQAGYSGEAVCGVVSFSLHAAQALALVGPNGAGKSTVVKTLVGQLEPVSGTTLINGSAVDDRTLDFRREVAVVFDDDAFFPSLTVEEHLAIVAAGHGVDDVEEVISSELEFFGLTEQAKSRPYNLSSGQRRRMLLASAFVRPRSLLVLDEPEQRLDTSMRHRLATRLRAEVDAGLALLVVTHDPDFLSTVATKAIFVSDTIHAMTPTQAAVAIASENPHAD